MQPTSTHTPVIKPGRLPGTEIIQITSTQTFPRHSHDEFGIGWMSAGAHRSWSGRGLVEAVSGDVITVNPNELHDGAPFGAESRTWCMMFLAPELVDDLTETRAQGRELSSPVATDPRLQLATRDAFGALTGENAIDAQEKLCCLLADLFDRPSPCGTERGSISAPVHRVAERIRDEPNEAVSLNELASLTGMSRTGALRRFRREIGATPSDYAMQLRVRRARFLISAGTSLTDVALAAGFADQSHMTRAFKRQFGVPPGRYRSAVARSNIVQDAD